MKIWNRIFSLAALFGLLIHPAGAQEPSPYDEPNPDFKLEKIELPYKANFRNANIIGRHPDGRLLVMCSNEKDPDGPRAGRQFFWINKDDTTVEEKGEIFEAFDLQYLREIARFDDNTIFFTKEIGGKPFFYRGKVDKTGKVSAKQKVDIACWEDEIRNPVFFHPRTSRNPVLLFCARQKGKKDYDIFYSELIDGAWSCPAPLAANGVNTAGYNETHPNVDKDGTLFFSSDRPESPDNSRPGKKSDLWFALPTHKPFWENASVNMLPAPFNSRGDERVILPVETELRSGFLISDSTEGPLKLYAFQSTTKDSLPPPPRYYALLVGVDDYQHMKSLNCPVRECRELAEVLSNTYGFNVETLENPSSAQFLEKLAEKQSLEENEYLIVAFMGHGSRYIRPNFSGPNNTCSILSGSDGRCLTRAADNITCLEYENCITPDEFVATLGQISRPRHLLVILDACRSGLFKSVPTRSGEFDNKSRRILASTIGELVPDCGVFFTALSQTLQEGPEFKDGIMTGQELFNEIFRKMGIARDNLNMPAYFPIPDYENGGHFPFPPKRK